MSLYALAIGGTISSGGLWAADFSSDRSFTGSIVFASTTQVKAVMMLDDAHSQDVLWWSTVIAPGKSVDEAMLSCEQSLLRDFPSARIPETSPTIDRGSRPIESSR